MPATGSPSLRLRRVGGRGRGMGGIARGHNVRRLYNSPHPSAHFCVTVYMKREYFAPKPREGEQDMSERQLAYALILVGIVAALVSVLADTLGIGGSDEFGYLQIIGLVAGVVVALIGLYLAYFRRRPTM